MTEEINGEEVQISHIDNVKEIKYVKINSLIQKAFLKGFYTGQKHDNGNEFEAQKD